jgi:hypothetical protein
MTKLHLHDVIEERARTDGSYAVAYALLKLADAQTRTARSLERMGMNDASGPMGAIEMVSYELKRIADHLDTSGD